VLAGPVINQLVVRQAEKTERPSVVDDDGGVSSKSLPPKAQTFSCKARDDEVIGDDCCDVTMTSASHVTITPTTTTSAKKTRSAS